MTLVLNLPGAVKQVVLASTNKERIEAVNRLTEEFFSTLGILFYTRYSTLQAELMCSIHPDVVQLMKDHFGKPTFDSWMRLVKLCADYLQLQGDNVATRYEQMLYSEVPEEYRQQSKQILKSIQALRGVDGFKPPKKPKYYQILKGILLLRNFRSHEWDSNPALQPLISSRIDKIIPRLIRDIMSCVDVRLIIPMDFNKKGTEVIVISGTDVERDMMPAQSEYMRYRDECYLQFFADEDPFRFRTNLIMYDRDRNSCYTYCRFNKGVAIYEHVPVTGLLDKCSKSYENLERLFELPELTSEPLEQKYGRTESVGDTIHNLPPRLENYIERSKTEDELIKKLGHRKLYITTLDGGGGFGKTELAKKVVWDLIENPNEEVHERLRFKYVVWVSGKTEFFTQGRIVTSEQSFRTVEDLVDSILYVTGNAIVINQPLSGKRKLAVEVLNKSSSTLLMLDNLETVSEREKVWDYLIELGDAVETDLKVLVTSRVRTGRVEQVLTLRSMTDDEACQLTLMEMNRLDVPAAWKQDSYVKQIVSSTGNIPLLIRHFVNLISHGHTLKEITERLPGDSDDALRFMCNMQWSELEKPAQKLLSGIAFWGGKINFAQAKLLCSLSNEAFTKAKEQLVLRSFLIDHSLIDSVLELLPPISMFAKAKLYEFPEFEKEFLDNESLLKPYGATGESTKLFEFTDEIALNQLFQRAELLAKRGAIKEAYGWYKEATERFPDNSLAWRSKGEFEYRHLDDDEVAEKSMDRAAKLEPKNALIYNTWAYWEYDRGVKNYSKLRLMKSVRLNERALNLTSDEAEKKKIIDFIASAYMKLGYIAEDDWGRAIAHKRRDYANEKDAHFRYVIHLLEGNLYATPQTPQEIHHNLIDYNMLANACLFIGEYKSKDRILLDDCALLYLKEGLDLDMFNTQLRYTTRRPGIVKALNRHGCDVSERDSISDIIDAVLGIHLEEARQKADHIISP